MATALRKTGISIVGDLPWGTHFCHFYETKQDLLDTLIPYFKAGLESREFCVWVVSDSQLITVEEAKGALKEAVPDLDRHLSNEDIEILNGLDWYLEENVFNLERVTKAWDAKLKRALDRGYDGMRVSGDTFWLREKDWKDFFAYEKQLNDSITDQQMTVLCTYPLAKSGAAEVLDVVHVHQFAIARRQGEWEIIETPELIQAKREIKRLNEELEQRVTERTEKLEETTELLRVEIEERKKREVELQRTGRALRLVSGSNLTLVRLTDETTVLNEVCRLAVEVGSYKLAWIGFAEHDERKTVTPVAHAGFEGGYLESANITWADEPRGHGPAGIAIRAGKPVVVRNIPTDPTLEPWRAQARQTGYQSSVTLPLQSEGQTFGFLAIYAAEPDAFDDGEVRVLSELANDLAFGVTVLRTRAARNQAEQALRESEERFRQVAENIREVFWLSRTDFSDILYVSAAYETVWGRTRESLYRDPRSFIDAIHPEDRARVMDVIERERARGPFEVEYRVVRPDESICWIRDRGFPIKDEAGRFYRVAGIAEDITERKEAEEAVRESQQLVRLVLETLPVGVAIVNRAGDIVQVNGASKRIWGGTIVGGSERWGQTKGYWHDSGQRIAPESWASVRALSKGETSLNELIDIETYDGRRKTIHNSVAPILNEEGLIVGAVIVNEDITDRVRAEEALRRSEDHLRLVIDTIPAMTWSIRPDGVVDFLNQRWMEYSGLSLQEYVANPTGPIHPEDVPRVIDRWLVEMAVGEAYEEEMRLRRVYGEYRWFLVRTAPLRDEQGNVVKWYGVSVDIEDRKQAEEKLRHSEVQLAEAQRLAHIGSWDWNLRTNAVTWSEELYHIFGLQPGTISVAGEVNRFIHPDDLDLGWDTVKRAVASKEPYDYYHRILRPDGTERIARSRGSIVSDERGEPIGVFGATQDVTELKRAEEKLNATTQQLRALSARLSSAREEEGSRIARELHDELGAALTSLKWDLEDMSNRCSEEVNQRDYSVLRQKIEVMMGLVDGILNSVRRISSELRPGILDDLGLLAAIEWQARQFESRSGITCRVDSLVDDVRLSREQSTEVFRILQEALTNVLRHAHARKVNIVVEELEGEFVLEVRDNGRGITEGEIAGSLSLV